MLGLDIISWIMNSWKSNQDKNQLDRFIDNEDQYLK